VKRTLTDEQIRIFRHSEIHALLRARQLEEDDAEYQARRQIAEDEPEAENDTHAGNTDMKNTAGFKRQRSSAGRTSKTHQRSHDTPAESIDYEQSPQNPRNKPKPERHVAYPGRKIVSYAD
jgi:hypothetical protein